MARPTTTAPETPVLDLPGFDRIAADGSQQLVEVARFDESLGELVTYDRESIITEIRFLQNQTAEAMLEIGKRLLRLKEHEPHGEWLTALETLGMQPRLAQKLMQAAFRFANTPAFSALAKLSRSTVLELAILDDEEIDELGREGGTVRGLTLSAIECMSVRELREALRRKDREIADAKAKAEAVDKVLAAKNSKIDELSVALEGRKGAAVEWTDKQHIDAIALQAGLIQAQILTELPRVILAAVAPHEEACRPPPGTITLAAAQALGTLIQAARQVAADYGLDIVDDPASAIRGGDDARDIWSLVNQELPQ